MDRKWIHLLFAGLGIVLMYVFTRALDWGWSSFGKPNVSVVYLFSGFLSLFFVILAWSNQRIFGFLHDSLTELSKVSWPTGKETGLAVLVVALTVVIAALFLGGFDAIGSLLARVVY